MPFLIVCWAAIVTQAKNKPHVVFLLRDIITDCKSNDLHQPLFMAPQLAQGISCTLPICALFCMNSVAFVLLATKYNCALLYSDTH